MARRRRDPLGWRRAFDAVYGPGQPEGETLPELLSAEVVLRGLDQAAGDLKPRGFGPAGKSMNNRFSHTDRETDERRTAALLGLIVILSLAIVAVVLIRQLTKESQLEDCLMSGRTNCAPIELPLRQ